MNVIVRAMWKVVYVPEAEDEFNGLDAREAVAVENVVRKLEALGPELPFPHSSNVEGAENLRELRPRGGRSRTRPLYRRIGDVFVIGSVGPEAQVDSKGFKKACRTAETRLDKVEE